MADLRRIPGAALSRVVREDVVSRNVTRLIELPA